MTDSSVPDDTLIRADTVHKRFGGITAVDGVVFAARRSLAIVDSTSSSLDGMPADMIFGSPPVISTSSSRRTPMPLYFSKAGRMAAMNFSFSGVLGRLSSASRRK